MQNTAVNRVLSGLDLGTEGLIEDRRDRIRVAIDLIVGGV